MLNEVVYGGGKKSHTTRRAGSLRKPPLERVMNFLLEKWLLRA